MLLWLSSRATWTRLDTCEETGLVTQTQNRNFRKISYESACILQQED